MYRDLYGKLGIQVLASDERWILEQVTANEG